MCGDKLDYLEGE